VTNAIGNERIVSVDRDSVCIRVRTPKGRRPRTTRIDGPQFIGRFLRHVLPCGFKRIRHYGLLAAGVKSGRLAQARAALAMPAPNPRAREDVAAFMRRVAAIDIGRCARCGCVRLTTVQIVSPTRTTFAAPRPGSACRGPP